ncbi:MAG: cell division protein ZapE [Halocynthiibacter sp.]|jgi:cell division protein ZapE
MVASVNSEIVCASIRFPYETGLAKSRRMNMTIQDIYAARVAAGALRSDPAQVAVLPMLEVIREGLHGMGAAGAGKGLLRGLFSRGSDADLPKGLYLWGGVGRGKSMVMDLFFEAVDAPKRRVHFHAFMQEVHRALHAARARGVEDALRPVGQEIAASVRLLCFDEMQISDITDAMLVGRLFEMLFEAGVVVVTTSNRVPDALYKDGLNRQLFLPFIEVLKDKLEVHHLHSPVDYRQGRLTGTPVYFTPVNSEARVAMDDIWRDLTGGAAEPLTLSVNKREVVIPAFRDGIGRASFWELCGKMLGAADYLAIADAVRVLLLEDVPALGRSNFNEAKRFVTLIDALYEAQVRLVISAAADPEHLYLEGEGTFEFERTASRLREMQDQDWGSESAD